MSPFTSPFFSNTTGYTGEVTLLDDLVREQIKLFGVDIVYMPRRMLNLDRLLHEASKSVFEMGLSIPMYIKTFDGFDNGMEMLSKFGVRSSDEITLQMSRSEFTTYYAPFIKSYHNGINGNPEGSELNHLEGETEHRPKEGDLIYFPFDDGIFEIKYVNFDQPFFQLGRGYVFEIQCERFEYSGETFETGYDEVDDDMQEPDYYRLEFQLESTGDGTFEFQEKVIIINLTDEEFDIYDGGGAYMPEYFEDIGDCGDADTFNVDLRDSGDANDIAYTSPNDVFRLYKDPGYVWRYPSVEATVMTFNKPEGVLTVGDLTNLDPEQVDFFRDLTVNKFDKVVILGESGSMWYSKKAYTQDKAFDDGSLIQQEFDAIKVVDDPFDNNPFGFV